MATIGCEKCGAFIKLHNKFCPKCGAAVSHIVGDRGMEIADKSVAASFPSEPPMLSAPEPLSVQVGDESSEIPKSNGKFKLVARGIGLTLLAFGIVGLIFVQIQKGKKKWIADNTGIVEMLCEYSVEKKLADHYQRSDGTNTFIPALQRPLNATVFNNQTSEFEVSGIARLVSASEYSTGIDFRQNPIGTPYNFVCIAVESPGANMGMNFTVKDIRFTPVSN